jgi:hypothetical protein
MTTGPLNTTQADAWVELAISLGETEFVARHPGFFLVASEEAIELSTLFDTDVVDFGAGSSITGRRKFDVRWITKAADSPYPDRISIGRARNCDLPFRHPSVSKLHAHLQIEGPRLMLIDRKSRNGTRVNGKRLAPDRPHPLAVRDQVEFGRVQALVLDGPELFELLARMI